VALQRFVGDNATLNINVYNNNNNQMSDVYSPMTSSSFTLYLHPHFSYHRYVGLQWATAHFQWLWHKPGTHSDINQNVILSGISTWNEDVSVQGIAQQLT